MAIAWILMGLFAELVFDSAMTTSRAYEAEVDRYLQRRGFSVAGKTRPLRAH